jgi:hypothetical protein
VVPPLQPRDSQAGAAASALILQAEQFARRRWPYLPRFFTYVDPAAVRGSNPGFCFQKAGWRRCGVTARGLIILEKLIVPESFLLPW